MPGLEATKTPGEEKAGKRKNKGRPVQGEPRSKGGESKRGQEKSAAERRRAAIWVRRMLENMEAKIDSKEMKATLGDFIRLLQLQKELEEEEIKEIKVTWVEPSETDCADSK